MEINNTNVTALCQYLQNTLSSEITVRKEAEKSLSNVEMLAGYAPLLMAVMKKQDLAVQIRVACAVTFKNFVKHHWAPADEADTKNNISESDREMVKSEVLNLMLYSPDLVRRQLAETVSLIGSHDFPDKWPTLIGGLIEKFSCGDLQIVNSTLLTADSLFKRYGHEMKSDRLWTEIKYVLDNFAAPLLALFEHVTNLAFSQVHANAAAEQLKPIYECLTLIARIFYSLNAQDLPEFFEDNMQKWMEGFLKLLSTNVPCLRLPDDDEDEEAGVVEELWSQICDNIAMYAQKYDEEFGQYLPPFVQVVWQLLVSTGSQSRYDLLVSNAVQFLASVCERPQYRALFADGDALAQICQRVVVPNIQLRRQDEELFADNPEEFIRRDIEGSDVDTRRRSAADLVKALCRQFEADVVRIFSAYINQLFSAYATDPLKNWPQKDAAVYLVETLTLRGHTARLGATKTSQLVDLHEFYNSHVAADLESADINTLPVLKAGALKFLVTFRSQLPKERLMVSALPACVNLLAADSVVVHSYAAHAVERLISTIDPSVPKKFLFTPEEFSPIASKMIQNLFGILDKPGSTENEYAMKCIMRFCSFFNDKLHALIESMLRSLTAKISQAAKNPSKPFFNHYLFETLCLLIRARTKLDQSVETTRLFEDALFPPFQDILQQDVQEFMPYVFQILALVLDTRQAKSGAPDSYRALFPFLLVPALWERQGNVPALVKLMQAFMRVDAEFVTSTHLNPVLGVFQKLLASKTHDGESFLIVEALLNYCTLEQVPRDALQSLLRLFFTRLMSNKTPRLLKNLVRFSSIFSARFGAKTLVELFDSVQPGIFGMFCQKVLAPELPKMVGGVLERKVCALGVIGILVEIPDVMLTGPYSHLWPELLKALLSLFELPEEASGEDDSTADVLAEGQTGYSAAYSQLTYAVRSEHDPCSQVQESPKAVLANSLRKLSTSGYGPQVAAAVELLDQQPKAFLQRYMASTGTL